MNKRFLATSVVAFFALAMGIFAFATTDVEAQDYSGHTAVLGMAEYLTVDGEGHGETWYIDTNQSFELLQRDSGNGQLSHDYVYNDPRNAGFDGGEAEVTLAVVTGNTSTDANLTNQTFWLTESVNVWQNLNCSNLNVIPRSVDPNFPGIVNIFFSGGGIPPIWQADLTQVGFLSAAEFPYFADNPNVLGVAFTLFWTDENGEFTDIDGNGKFDVAFREIYYNDEFTWADNGLEGTQPDGTRLFDFPTVAIHEAGHGLSAAHFGSIGRQGGQLVARPRSIMNAIYGGLLRELTGRDVGSHCSNWAQWPNN